MSDYSTIVDTLVVTKTKIRVYINNSYTDTRKVIVLTYANETLTEAETSRIAEFLASSSCPACFRLRELQQIPEYDFNLLLIMMSDYNEQLVNS